MTILYKDGKMAAPSPAKPLAKELADAIYNIFSRRLGLDFAKERVPAYTGDLSNEDYYAEEQENYNRAADRLLEVFESLNDHFEDNREERKKLLDF